MLILSRKEGEEIVIGNDVRVVVTQISGDRVRLGIIAPRDMPVFRQEVLDRTEASQQENQS